MSTYKNFPDNVPEHSCWHEVLIAPNEGTGIIRGKAFWFPGDADKEGFWLFRFGGCSHDTHHVMKFGERITNDEKAVFHVKPLENNSEVDFYCPKCKPLVKMRVKTNRNNGNQFLGCPNWPDCDHTQPIPEEVRMRQAGQKGLFDTGAVKAGSPADGALRDSIERNPQAHDLEQAEELTNYKYGSPMSQEAYNAIFGGGEPEEQAEEELPPIDDIPF